MTSKLTYLLCALGACMLTTSPAAADYSLREKKLMKWHEEVLAKSVKAANEKCGAKVKATIDWRSWRKEMNRILDGKVKRGIGSYCQLVPDALWSMCNGSKDAKKAIARKIRSYSCKFGGKGKRRIVLRGGTISFWVDWKAANNGYYIKQYLGKKL
jgi:hypothetical protein